MNKEENREFLKNAIKQADSDVVESKKVISDEDMWNSIKLKAQSFLEADDICITTDERQVLKERIDNFKSYGPSIIKACSERYKKDVLAEDIKVRKAHEFNEAAKVYVSNKDAGIAVLTGLANLFGTPAPQPTLVNEVPKSIETSKKQDVKVDVSLLEE